MKAATEPRRAAAVEALLRDALEDVGTAWSLGSFGALAEFMRDVGEPFARLSDGRLGGYTARGALALSPTPDLRPVAYETANPSGWNHAVALCLPQDSCAMNRREVVTELGPDLDAPRAQDREGVLFDLGLGLLAVDACVRSRDPETITCLRAGAGKPVFDHSSPIGRNLVAMSPHRVFLARIGRVEVFQPIPPPDGKSPEGPHTHVMPKLLASGRTHAATTPIPDGLVPVAGLHPPHPYKDAMGERIPFDRARHEAFQALLLAWGDPVLIAAKHGAEGGGRHAEAARRIAAMQARWLAGDESPMDESEPEHA